MNPKTSQSFETDKDPDKDFVILDGHTQHQDMGQEPIPPVTSISLISDDPAVYVYLHTHWDREWYLPFRQYQVRLAEVVDTLLTQIEAQVFPCFMLDGQTVLVDDYLELRPHQKNGLLSHIQSGQLNVGPWYVMPDELLVCGESLIRNLKKGMESAMAWGCSEFTGYLPDTFGHSGDLPYIFQQCGIQTAVVWRGVTLPDSLFVWKSPQGAQVLTSFLPKGYFQNVIQDSQLSQTERYRSLETLFNELKPFSRDLQWPLLFPLGGDHLGPPTSERFAEFLSLFPKAQTTTPPTFLNKLLTPDYHSLRQDLTTLKGELTDNQSAFLLPGVYSARLYLKQANRKLEHRLLRQTEPFVSLWQGLSCSKDFQALGKKKKPPRNPVEELSLAWTLLLQNHPHDSICGCSVDAVHRENESRFEQVAQLAESLEQRQRAGVNQWVTHDLSSDEAQDVWVLFNQGDRAYTGPVKVRGWCINPENELKLEANNKGFQLEASASVLQDDFWQDILEIPLAHRTMIESTGWIWAENIPAHGIQRVSKKASKNDPVANPHSLSTVRVFDQGMENQWLSLTLTDTGSLSVVDKKTQVTYPLIHFYQDSPEQGDSYNSAPVPGAKKSHPVLVGVEVTRSGPWMGELLLTFSSTTTSKIETKIQLMAHHPQIQFETTFTNVSPDHKLQVGFETGAPITHVSAESHFSVATRQYDPDYCPLHKMPALLNQELKTNTGPIQRFIHVNGSLLFTEGLAEYEVEGSVLWLTLLRAFGSLSKKDTGVRGNQAGPPLSTPEGQCMGRSSTYRYGWMPFDLNPSDNIQMNWAEAYHQADLFYGVVSGEQGRGNPPKNPVSGEVAAGETVPFAQYSLIHWDNPSLVSTSLRWSDKGFIVRILNTAHTQELGQFHTGFCYDHIECLNFLDVSEGIIESSVIPFAPLSVKTLLFCVK